MSEKKAPPAVGFAVAFIWSVACWLAIGLGVWWLLT